VDVLLACYTDSLGHAGRSSLFARLLARSGVRVEIAGGGQFDPLFQTPVHASPQVPYAMLGDWLGCYLPGLPFVFDGANTLSEPLHRRLIGEGMDLEALTQRWLKLLDEIRPDVIVADGRPEVYWAAHRLGIPLFGIMSFVWTEHFCERFAYFETDEHAPLHDSRRLEAFNRVGANLGLAPVQDCWAPFRGRAALLPDSLHFVGMRSGAGFLTLGPLVWSGPPSNGLDLSPGPFVYATTGTSQFAHIERLARRVAEAGVCVILSGDLRGQGTQASGTIPGLVSPNLVRWHGVAPGAALAGAADLVLSHGGSQTLYQAAMSGTFSCVVPYHFDHRRNATMFESFSLALVLPEDGNLASWGEIILGLLANGLPEVRLPPEEPLSPAELRRFLESS
jgi:hypothetical protein